MRNTCNVCLRVCVYDDMVCKTLENKLLGKIKRFKTFEIHHFFELSINFFF